MAVQTIPRYSVETCITGRAIIITRLNHVDKTQSHPIIKIDHKQIAIVEYKNNYIVTISNRV